MRVADVKAQINERIIKALSEGKIPWLKPWTENGPRNLFSGRAEKAAVFMIGVSAPVSATTTGTDAAGGETA